MEGVDLLSGFGERKGVASVEGARWEGRGAPLCLCVWVEDGGWGARRGAGWVGSARVVVVGVIQRRSQQAASSSPSCSLHLATHPACPAPPLLALLRARPSQFFTCSGRANASTCHLGKRAKRECSCSGGTNSFTRFFPPCRPYKESENLAKRFQGITRERYLSDYFFPQPKPDSGSRKDALVVRQLRARPPLRRAPPPR